jgi:uncharacterized membrane protein
VISLDVVYIPTGLVIWVFALLTLRDSGNPFRIAAGLFWFLFGAIFVFGSVMPHRLTGLLVLLMVAIDGAGRVCPGSEKHTPKEEQCRHAERFGNRIFAPILLIPIVTFAFALVFRMAGFDANRGALIGLGLGGAAAMFVCLRLTRSSTAELFRQGHRLNEAMGPVNILPQLLASLGVVFAAAQVGELVAGGIQRVIPNESLFLLVLANCLGMALFTIVMGNSFAAFPVVAAGVLIPLIVRPLNVDPAMAGIITLTAGSSGTLMTMMAANFNIVPAALLNMRDPYAVIKFQLPYALSIWSCHVLLMWAWIRLVYSPGW